MSLATLIVPTLLARSRGDSIKCLNEGEITYVPGISTKCITCATAQLGPDRKNVQAADGAQIVQSSGVGNTVEHPEGPGLGVRRQCLLLSTRGAADEESAQVCTCVVCPR
ncbi:hypothetical protein HPB50_026568 [Hyalomma asiaticum]|uniref:Uncharacterized protein n=1 Tax=Hyalomma asiaticum TaxID=266040 RepID=A0ACB7TTQ6_HYAAI|nr:hypothetical protein HPB50_026568 [Hyalomma asiaticum]